MKKENLEVLLMLARKSGDKFAVSVFSTMKGEIENQLKNNPNTSVDSLIETYALKSKKNLEQFKPEGYEKELSLIKDFLPKEVTVEDIVAFVEEQKANGVNEKSLLGVVMKNFKGVDVNLVKSVLA